MDLALFILLSFGLIVIPGPNVIIIVSTSLAHGKIRGLQTVAGTSCAMLVQMLVAAAGTAWFVAALSEGLRWLKWAGVAYLLYLGIVRIRSAFRRQPPATATALGSFQRGFWISLTNPKTILFFGAFLPQFVSTQHHYFAQVAMLSAMFWLMAVVLDSMYALLSSKLGSLFNSAGNSRALHVLSGGLYIGAGVALATAGRD